MTIEPRSANVLIVDDDPQIRSAMIRQARHAGHDADGVATAEEAWELARRRNYELALVDYHLPGIDGVVCVRRLRNVMHGAVFVLMTGDSNFETHALGDSLGLLRKPLDPTRVAELFANVGTEPQDSRLTTPAPRKILLVEDEPLDALQLQYELLRTPEPQFEIEHVLTLASALEAVKHSTFDAVLVDVSLPDSVGIEAITALLEAAPEMPLVVLTGHEDPRLAIRAMEHGAQDFLIKGKSGGNTIRRAIDYATERKRTERHLSRLAFHDPLTGLANRTHFQQRLASTLARSLRQSASFAVLSLDMDHFKRINDTFGHGVGDTFLQIVASRLTSSVRVYDVAARIGGDEFIVLVEEMQSRGEIDALAMRILEQLALPYEIDGQELQSSSSIGVAYFPESGQTADALLAAADKALYRAKAQGGGSFVIEDPALLTNRPSLPKALRPSSAPQRALTRKERSTHSRLRRLCVLALEALLDLVREGPNSTGGREQQEQQQRNTTKQRRCTPDDPASPHDGGSDSRGALH